MAEIIDALRAEGDREQARKEIEKLQTLLKGKEWELYLQLVQQQMTVIANQLIGPAVPDRAYLAGIVKGMDEAISLPKQLIALYDAQSVPTDNPLAQPGSPILDESPFPKG